MCVVRSVFMKARHDTVAIVVYVLSSVCGEKCTFALMDIFVITAQAFCRPFNVYIRYFYGVWISVCPPVPDELYLYIYGSVQWGYAPSVCRA